MLPSGTGSQPFAFSGTHKFDTIFDPNNYNFSGNPQNMVAVIFVQDVNASANGTDYYPIEAIDTIPLMGSAGVAETSAPSTHLMISSNPLISQGHIGFELESAGEVKLSLCDLLGREVRTLVESAMPAGQTSVEMNSVALPAGCYFARLMVDGHEADQEKFIVAP